MSIEKAIHERWENYLPLASLVPAQHIRTGWIPPVDTDFKALALPFVSVAREGDTEVLTPSGGITLTTTTIRFMIWSDDLAEAKIIADRMEDRFAESAYTYAEGRVLIMRRLSRGEMRADDGTWGVSLDYQTRTQEP